MHEPQPPPDPPEREHEAAADALPPSRRQLLAGASVGLQALLGAAVAIPWLGAFAFPLWGRVTRSLTGFVPVGAIARFREGEPVKVVIQGETTDAWRRTRDVSLGAAWVVRRTESDFLVLSTTCPHLGCAVNHDAAKGRFLCPCHGSHFALGGARLDHEGESNPSPRDMDPLEWKVDAGRLWVRYERFRTGTPDRVAV